VGFGRATRLRIARNRIMRLINTQNGALSAFPPTIAASLFHKLRGSYSQDRQSQYGFSSDNFGRISEEYSTKRFYLMPALLDQE
jgi:hypothetical protein